MKYIVRVFLFNMFALWLTSEIVPALVIDGNWITVVMAAFALSFLMVFVKPILKILFIPVNFLTFGLLSWFINVIMIYLLTIIIPETRIVPWIFPGFTQYGFSVPEVKLDYLPALILVAITITFISNFLHDVSES